jgi:hypothetical protein
MKDKMNIRKWYGRSVTVPSYTHSNYTGFLVSCLGIVRSIVEDNIGKRVTLRFIDLGTASADQEKALINVKFDYIKGYFNLPSGRVDSDTALSAILGIIVHESAHFAWSPATLLPFTDYVEEHTTCVFNQKLAATLGNIIEDIFIEAEVGRSVPSLSWMLDVTNEMILPEETQVKVVDKVRDIQEAPDNMLGVVAVLDALLLAKIHPVILSTPYIEQLFAEIRSATDLTHFPDRKQLTLSIYNKVMCNLKEEEGNGEGQEALDGLSDKAEGFVKKDAEEGAVIEHIVKSLNRRLDAMKDDKVTMVEDVGSPDSITPTNIYIERVLPAGTPVQMDARYQRLAEIGRQHATVNRPYGEQRVRGSNIRALHRIATDQKIFAEPLSMRNYKPMQVVILVDCSGSMDTGVDGTGKLRYELAREAALGAAYGLVHAHCDVAVYGHTAETLSGTEVSIFRFKGFKEPITVLSPRLGGIHVTSDIMNQNRDGYAISYVSKKLADKRKRRLLIVISDGQPLASYGYSGTAAVQHSKNVVDGVRKQGIDVLSISITENARRANDTIYGAKNNVFNKDPNVIEDIVRALVTK